VYLLSGCPFAHFVRELALSGLRFFGSFGFAELVIPHERDSSVLLGKQKK
jgi:hypothetical protein